MSEGRGAERGYLSQEYAFSFREFGEVINLPRSGLPLIKRKINDHLHDYVGLYPLSFCKDWSLVGDDLDLLRGNEGVSVVFVTEPFAERVVQSSLAGWTLCRPYKNNVVVNLMEDWKGKRTKKVRWETKRGRRLQQIQVVPGTSSQAELFWSLYWLSANRHKMGQMQRMSLKMIAEQLDVEGSFITLASNETGFHGAMIFYNQGETAYLHLMGLSETAYSIGTTYAMWDASFEFLKSTGCKRVSVGGAAGLIDDESDGLFRFKQKWSEVRATTFICGEVLDEVKYRELVKLSGNSEGMFFPAYRSPK
jgi:hypothetical protein